MKILKNKTKHLKYLR